MSEINTGGPAFPMVAQNWNREGMSLRDYFAAKAMPVHMAALSTWDAGSQEAWQKEISRLSYMTADAMLKARGEK